MQIGVGEPSTTRIVEATDGGLMPPRDVSLVMNDDAGKAVAFLREE